MASFITGSGPSGNGTVARQNAARNNLRGDDRTQVRPSWGQLKEQQRRGDGNASATEMRQQRIHTAEKKKPRWERPDPARFSVRSEEAKVRAMHAHASAP